MKQQKYHADSGFSLLEVLVSIVAITFFTAAAMQMMVISASLKTRAKEYTTATNLIKQDLENIRGEAAKFRFPEINLADDPGAVEELDGDNNPKVYLPEGETTITIDSAKFFTEGDDVQFTGTSKIYNISKTSENEITIASGLLSKLYQVRGNNLTTIAVNDSLCNGNASNGLASELGKTIKDQLDNNRTFSYKGKTYKEVIGKSYTLPNTNKKLWLMRKDEASNAQVLEIKYLVITSILSKEDKQIQDLDPNKDIKILAELSSEVIPDASYQCIKV